ncbi:hypothetical protein MD484_g8336, partial [Candolleomyces efflorescens]
MPDPDESAPPAFATPTASRRYAFGSADSIEDPPRTPTRSSLPKSLPLRRANSQTMLANARAFAERQCFSTPLAPSLALSSLDLSMDQRKEQLEDELVPSILEVSNKSGFASSLYRDLASDEEIKAFLQKADVYDWQNQRWLLPESIKGLKESEIQKPLVELLNAILEHFWGEEFARGLRKVVDTHTTPLPHKEAVETDYKSRPDCSVKAEGPSFQLPHQETKEDIGYSNMASFFEFKVEAKRLGFIKELLQVAAYVRQMFIQQPNRQFIRALLVSEQRFTLFHFDRSGVQHSQEFDLGNTQSQYLFVRLVVGLCSPHESDLGFDSSIQWEIENGRKASGTLKTRGDDCNGEITYTLANVDPIWSSFSIRGSCTTYWRVIDPQSGEKRLVKDSWRREGRESEKTFLEKAKGLPGVVQMIHCEDNRAETKIFRGFIKGSDVPENFQNLIAIRIIMKNSGRLLIEFTSAQELVSAFQDAIAGHQLLYEIKILHRDIAMHNILLGEPGAEPGNRGMLAGLDMAIFIDSDREIPESNVNGRSGDRTYWPIASLGRKNPDDDSYDGPHDHLDDLEAFLYVFAYMTHGYNPQGAMFDKASQELDREARGVVRPVKAPVSWSPGSFLGPQSSPNPCLDDPSETTPNRGTSSRLITIGRNQGSHKRAPEEDPDDQPESKRSGYDAEGPDEDPKTPSRPRGRARIPVIRGELTLSSPLRPKDSSVKKAL